jgi:hypothetical protein
MKHQAVDGDTVPFSSASTCLLDARAPPSSTVRNPLSLTDVRSEACLSGSQLQVKAIFKSVFFFFFSSSSSFVRS